MKNVVIGAHSGGMGDNLIFSTIPELFAREGHKVYLSARAPFRNEEVRDLVWLSNPFVCGVLDEEPNAGNAKEPVCHDRDTCSISTIEAQHGFEPSNQFPKIYYQPQYRPEFFDKVLCDPYSTSQPFAPALFNAFVGSLGYDPESLIVLESKHSGEHGRGALTGVPRYNVANLREYADLVYSCKAFLVTESGGHVLSSAIKGHSAFPRVHALCTAKTIRDKVFTFPNIRYSVVDI